MIDKISGYICAAVDTGHPLIVALLAVIFAILFMGCITVFVGILINSYPEYDEH